MIRMGNQALRYVTTPEVEAFTAIAWFWRESLLLYLASLAGGSPLHEQGLGISLPKKRDTTNCVIGFSYTLPQHLHYGTDSGYAQGAWWLILLTRPYLCLSSLEWPTTQPSA